MNGFQALALTFAITASFAFAITLGIHWCEAVHEGEIHAPPP